MDENEMLFQLLEAYGEERVDQLVCQTFGSITEAFRWAREEGTVE